MYGIIFKYFLLNFYFGYNLGVLMNQERERLISSLVEIGKESYRLKKFTIVLLKN